MGLVSRIEQQFFPDLERKLRMAKIEENPKEYLRKRLLSALYLSIGLTFGTFMFLDKMGFSIALLPLSFFVWYGCTFFLLMKNVDSEISKRRSEINKNVLFAGRFLLVKLNSGKSLIGALEDAANSYGVASSYFQEIIKDIDLGTPLEEALENATRTCPSEKMQKILFQITNSLKIGIDVSRLVESVLDDIAHEQLMEIEEYGEKLGTVALFYMLFAVVAPSLGLALLIVMASLISLNIGTAAFVAMGIFLCIIEVFFITIFKHIRPDVNV